MAEAEKDDLNGSPTDRVTHSEPDGDQMHDSDGEEQLDDAYDEEYSSLNNALDEISAFMDVLEERNDHLFEKVQQLLQDSRHARLKAQVEDQESDQEKSSDSQQPTSPTD